MKIIYEGKDDMFKSDFFVIEDGQIWLKCGDTDDDPLILLSKETALAMARAIIKELETDI
jgi:hypothetical protein